MILKLTMKESEHFSCNSHLYKYTSAADSRISLFHKQLHKGAVTSPMKTG